MSNTSEILRFVPRSGLYVIIGVMTVGLVAMGRTRVLAVEVAAQSASAEASEAKRQASRALDVASANAEETRLLRAVIEEIRREQLEHYRWQAERAGDWRRANEYGDKLRELPSKPR